MKNKIDHFGAFAPEWFLYTKDIDKKIAINDKKIAIEYCIFINFAYKACKDC